jgi:hypothetical protein
VAKDEALRKAKVLLELHQRPHPKEVAEDEALLKAMALALLSLLPQLLLLLLLQVHQGVIILFSCSCDGNEIQGLAERMQE